MTARGVTTILTVLTFATAGQDEVKGSSTMLWVDQAALIVNHMVKVKQFRGRGGTISVRLTSLFLHSTPTLLPYKIVH